MADENVQTGTTDAEALTLTPAELEERINAAREQAAKDEREKLYGRLKEDKQTENAQMKALKDELATLTKAQQAQERQREKERQAAEKALQKEKEAELSAKDLLERREAEWSGKFNELQTTLSSQLEQERAVREREQEFAKLSAYTQRRAAEESETIEPHLIKYINGNTPEEVELSIKQLQADSQGIYQSSEQHFKGARAAMPGSAPTGNTPGGPLEDQDFTNREITAEDIRKMSMPEYAQFRKQTGVGQSASGRGLYQ